jgi:hypothetical protein
MVTGFLWKIGGLSMFIQFLVGWPSKVAAKAFFGSSLESCQAVRPDLLLHLFADQYAPGHNNHQQSRTRTDSTIKIGD